MGRRRKAAEQPLNDRERLEDYRRVMDEVRTTRLAREGGSYSVNIGAQDPAASTMPDADSIRSLFVTFRHVLAQQSDTQFTKVCKVLDREQLTDEEGEVLKKCRALWKDVLSSDPLKLVVNGGDISPERMIDLYFNGRDFHRDRDKRLLRESIESGIGQAFAMARVLQSVWDLVRAANYVDQIVGNVLERDPS